MLFTPFPLLHQNLLDERVAVDPVPAWVLVEEVRDHVGRVVKDLKAFVGKLEDALGYFASSLLARQRIE